MFFNRGKRPLDKILFKKRIVVNNTKPRKFLLKSFPQTFIYTVGISFILSFQTGDIVACYFRRCCAGDVDYKYMKISIFLFLETLNKISKNRGINRGNYYRKRLIHDISFLLKRIEPLFLY